ncbi:hypothetical protein C8Q74DRAFT_1253264 [Fomes fomentarius]|nr:hypothetical protein C8Q74DRAFT_1253264 [Fomes fomentarius]
MAANTAFAFARTASNLASSAFTTGSSMSSTKGPFPSTHRPKSLEVQRKLRESLGHGLPSTTTQRKVRAPAATFVPREVYVHSATPTIPSCYVSSTIPSTTPSSSRSLAASIDHQPWREIVEAPSPSMLPTPHFGRPHLPHRTSRNIFEAPSPSMLPTPHFGRPYRSSRMTGVEAPSPSMLPTPPDFDRPLFPHRRSRLSSAHKASQGVARLFILEGDAIVSPSDRQLHAESFRRTPGAPSGRKALTQCASETGHAARIGLGLMIAGQSFPGVV